MFDFIKSAVNTLAGPLASVVDLAGDTLGLPPVLTNTIKAATGVATGNVMMVASGAMGVMSELQQNPAAQTEFCPSPNPEQAQAGYAKPAQTASAATPGSSGGLLEPSVREYRDSLRIIAANYGLLDTMCGSKNDKFDLDTLRKAANHPNLSPELRRAARFLLEHPEYRNRVDTGAKGGKPDGTISKKDVQEALKKVNQEIAHYGIRETPPPPVCTPPPPVCTPPPPVSTPPPPVSTPPPPPVTCTPPPGQPSTPSGGEADVSSILNNPHMSVEEKIQAILMLITRDTDDEILDVMQQMASARGERAGLGTDEAAKAREAKLETTMQELNLRLQKLMEKRKQMFDLMSTISSKFNEMAKMAIQNMGRA